MDYCFQVGKSSLSVFAKTANPITRRYAQRIELGLTGISMSPNWLII